MSRLPFRFPTTRREFLRQSASGLGLIAFGNVAPLFLTESVRAAVPKAEKDRSILVLIQLAGGNDGLNTLVPYADDHYYRLRPSLALRKETLHRLDDQHGFHASCGEMAGLFHEGQLAIVQNVGYPNPNRSHFRSMEIWETAVDSQAYANTGWIGRYFDNCCAGQPGEDPLGLSVGNELPDSFLADHDHNIFGLAEGQRAGGSVGEGMRSALEDLHPPEDSPAHFLQHTLMNALVTEEKILRRIRDYQPMAAYPSTSLGQSLEKVAGLIASGQETRVYFVSHGGFDTHANQANRHSVLLKQLSQAMSAFQADLVAHRLDDQVLTMTFSEFGRRPSENVTGGTDHGTAAPLFVMGSALQGNLFGQAPKLNLEKNRDLSHSTDFRSVYSTIVEHWFDADPAAILGRRFDGPRFI